MNVGSEPLVSIVTPVYNEEEYLAECIESILAQTYRNWEYTIVDNCSTDRSLQIAQSFAAKDSRIRVIRNEQFLDMIPNHNVAIRQISRSSKYCKVVLGDDWIFPTCIEKMVSVAESYLSVGLVSAYETCGDHIRLTGLPKEAVFYTGREACRDFLLERHFLFGAQTSVLYRADLVRSREPFYSEKDMYPDFESCFYLLRNSDLGFVHEVLTFSRLRSRSVGAISADLGATYRSYLGLLFSYGKQCLTEEEFAEALDNRLSQYYRFLGRRLLLERGEFWDYHKKTFENLGIPFRRARLVGAAAGQLCASLVQPKSTLESLTRLMARRKIRNRELRKVVFDNATSADSGGKHDTEPRLSERPIH